MSAPRFIWRDYVHVPLDRVGALIGEGGRVKREIERRLGVELKIDSESGVVEVKLREGGDPSRLFKAKDVVTAIASGFSPERAFKLVDDDVSLAIVDLREYVGDSEKDLVRIKGRIIGEEGRARKFIEEATGALVSVYGDKVAIIGDFESLEIAKRAVEMLAEGRQHSTVYRFLMAKRRELKRRRMMAMYGVEEGG
ncbi:RNA-processing protein [Candidatus Geothermarchaeota archaeon ex4572_27]|nr:MAG: RNA-processing protein [Candidatus Geothermarchaeota archaeon ex4572_27]